MNEDDQRLQEQRLPDYRLIIVSGRVLGLIDIYKSFDMFVDQRLDLDEKNFSINGTIESSLKTQNNNIEDRLEIGTFNGNISDEKNFHFTINYNGNAIYFNVPKGKVLCVGKKIKSAYIGCFEYIKTDTDNPTEVVLTTDNRFGIRKYDPENIYNNSGRKTIKKFSA